MHCSLRYAALAAFFLAFVSGARAEGFSTSAVSPTPVASSGLITGNFPASDAETSYYFAIDLKAGELATQIAFLGRPGRDKSFEFELKDPRGKRVSSYYIMEGLN